MSFHLCGESLAYTVVWQEIMTIMVALSTFAEEIQGRKVILYSDNKGAPSRLCVFGITLWHAYQAQNTRP